MLKYLQHRWETTTIDPYQVFFGAIAVHILALLLGLVLLVIQTDTAHPMPLWALPLCSLAAVTVMMNIGDHNPTAKEVFWAWIILSVGITVFAFYGQFIIWVFV